MLMHWQCKAIKTTVLVKGQVTQTGVYCGGARPTQAMLDEIGRPKPLPFIKLFILNGSSNTGQAIIKTIETDAHGNFYVQLQPGSYCFVDSTHIGAYQFPAGDSAADYNLECIKQLQQQCLYNLTVDKNSDEVLINYNTYCPWNMPCLQNRKPLPPVRN